MDRESMEMTPMSNDGRSVAQLRLPPGFRFNPTDAELIWDYLKKQANSEFIELRVIAEVDLSKHNPWDLPAQALYGEKEWYFFTHRERKYPKGTRPNRAAAGGYWKATGTDKRIYRANHVDHSMHVGFKKALVFYAGRAPRGQKTNWIMHEYRLADGVAPAAHIHHRGSTRLDDWVLCRIYEKHSSLAQRAVVREHDLDSMLSEFDEQIPIDSPTQEQGVVDNATTTINFPAMMQNIPGAMTSTVPGMQQTIASSSGWTSQHTIASSSQHAGLTHELAVETGLQTGPAPNYLPQLQQFHQPRSSSSFTGPVYYNACIGADAGQRSSFSDGLEEVQSQVQNFASYGEGALYPGFDHPPADDQSSTYPLPPGMGNFGYGQPPGRNS